MARRLRFIPEGGALVEVTCRTIHGRFLLKPSRRLNQIVLGVLGRAQRKQPVKLVSFVFLSNHYHLLLWVPNAQRLAAFMNFFNGNLAKEAGRLTNWREKFWSRRYRGRRCQQLAQKGPGGRRACTHLERSRRVGVEDQR